MHIVQWNTVSYSLVSDASKFLEVHLTAVSSPIGLAVWRGWNEWLVVRIGWKPIEMCRRMAPSVDDMTESLSGAERMTNTETGGHILPNQRVETIQRLLWHSIVFAGFSLFSRVLVWYDFYKSHRTLVCDLLCLSESCFVYVLTVVRAMLCRPYVCCTGDHLFRCKLWFMFRSCCFQRPGDRHTYSIFENEIVDMIKLLYRV